MSGTLRIGVLGPLTATVDGAPVPLAGRRLLGVLAALVAGRPEPQKPDRLMADVWHDEPSVAANTVQYQISRLRALAEEAHLDPAFAEKFLNFIISEVIRHHQDISQNHSLRDE